MWVGHFWGPLQGALSQFIDIQGFDPLTTGMSLRLRQPCLSVLCWAEKPGGPPDSRSPLHGCHGEQISPAALCHIHVGTFSLSSSLSILSLTFYRAASPRGLPKRAFCQLTMPGVLWTSPYINSAKKSRLWKCKGFSSKNAWQQIYFLSVEGFEWVDGVFVSKDMSSQVVNPCCRSSSPNNNQSYFIPQLQQWRTIMSAAKQAGVICYYCIITLVYLDNTKYYHE